MRKIGLLFVVVLAGVVYSAMQHGWTTTHYQIAAVLAGMAVVALMPAGKPSGKSSPAPVMSGRR
jgi:peptidoglycan/LPS O-acetylase OafA/YrhL